MRRHRFSNRRVGAEEQVADGTPAQIREPAPAQMLGAIVLKMAALAPGGEIGIAVPAGIMLTMTGRQDRHRQPRARQIGHAPQCLPPVGAPSVGLYIVPAPVVEADDDVPVRPPASLAASTRSFEADHRRELRPVDRIEIAEFGADRHEPSITPSQTERFPPRVAFRPVLPVCRRWRIPAGAREPALANPASGPIGMPDIVGRA